jgi:hypothetical protein
VVTVATADACHAKSVSGMVIDTLGSTLQTGSMVSVCTPSPMGIPTRALGMKGRSRDSECTHFGTVKSDLGSGILKNLLPLFDPAVQRALQVYNNVHVLIADSYVYFLQEF